MDALPMAKINVGGTFNTVWGGGQYEIGTVSCIDSCDMGCRSSCTSYCWNSCSGYCGTGCTGMCNSCTGSSISVDDSLSWVGWDYTYPQGNKVTNAVHIGLVRSGYSSPLTFVIAHPIMMDMGFPLGTHTGTEFRYSITSQNAYNIFNSGQYTNIVAYVIGYYGNDTVEEHSGPTFASQVIRTHIQEIIETPGYTHYSTTVPWNYVGANVAQARTAFLVYYGLKYAPSQLFNSRYRTDGYTNAYANYKVADVDQVPDTFNGYDNPLKYFNKYPKIHASLGSITDEGVFAMIYKSNVLTGNSTNAKIRVGGTWKQVAGMKMNVSNTWKSI